MLEYDYEKMYDAFLGINTKEEEEWEEEGISEEYNRYEVTPYDALSVACEQLRIKPTDCVVDFGCGKGRILFFFNNFFLCRTKGIELDDELYQQLEDNKAYYDVRFKERGRMIDLYHMKAEEYTIAKEDNVFYFFNPCSPEHFAEILENIVVSIEESFRVVTLILYYGSDDYLRIIRDMCWKQKRMIRLPNYMEDTDEKMYIFQNPVTFLKDEEEGDETE